jgi:hypothetical protein
MMQGVTVQVHASCIGVESQYYINTIDEIGWLDEKWIMEHYFYIFCMEFWFNLRVGLDQTELW